MTITGLMDAKEKIEHLKRYAARHMDALELDNAIRSINNELIGE